MLGHNRAMHWEVLRTTPTAVIRRAGRFLVADLQGPHRALTTSAKNGGQTEHLRHLVNHQSCEGSGHEARAHLIVTKGQEAYHDDVCAEVGVPAGETAVMGTAANMNYAALVAERDADVEVLAIVTAGVQTNAVCAGDPAAWRESRDGIVKVPAVAGTINTMLVVNTPVHPAVLARLAVNVTEAKSAALQQLAVPSCSSPDLATGTGTDQFCIAAPRDGGTPLSSASPHMKFGEIVGRAVRAATVEALRWQNGLEASFTRGLFHALGRYGVREQTIVEDLTGKLDASDLELLRRNSKAAFYEPLAGAAAHALAAVLDRARHGTLPGSVLPEAALQQAATLAANLAAAPHRWVEFHERLRAVPYTAPKDLVLDAVALGWREKWRSS
jgi:adenosylcobinamide amidohydrolase